MVEKINIELFLDNLPKDCTTKEVIKKICSLDIERSEAQKRYIENLDAHSAVLRLVTLGYREEAKKIARHCYNNSRENYNLKFAREMAEFLMNHEYKFGSLLEAKEWEQRYLELDKIIRAQIKAKRMYGKVLNNYMMGLSMPRKDIKKMLQTLKENFKYDSVWYLYYYYQIKSVLLEGKELESMILEAVAIFEKRYIKHSNFVVIFKMELINYYKHVNDYDRAIKLVEEANSLTKINTIQYMNVSFVHIELLSDMSDYTSAWRIYNENIEYPMFKQLPSEQKIKWELLYKRIMEERRQ